MLPQSSYFSLHEVTEGIYVAIATAGSGTRSNSGIIDLGNQTIVFDTTFNPLATLTLRQIAETLTGRPVTYLLNSHRHADHVIGNALFGEVPIVATASTRDLIAELTAPMVNKLRTQQAAILAEVTQEIAATTEARFIKEYQQYQADLEAVFPQLDTLELVLPTLTFAGQMTFHGSQRNAHFISYGANHTPDDAILYLPDDGIVFTGDMVTIHFHPVLGQGDPDHWIENMTRLESLHLKAVIPGHGPVGTGADISMMKQYLIDITTLATQIAERGATESDIIQMTVPAIYQAYEWPSTYGVNLQRMVTRYQQHRE